MNLKNMTLNLPGARQRGTLTGGWLYYRRNQWRLLLLIDTDTVRPHSG